MTDPANITSQRFVSGATFGKKRPSQRKGERPGIQLDYPSVGIGKPGYAGMTKQSSTSCKFVGWWQPCGVVPNG